MTFFLTSHGEHKRFKFKNKRVFSSKPISNRNFSNVAVLTWKSSMRERERGKFGKNFISNFFIRVTILE